MEEENYRKRNCKKHVSHKSMFLILEEAEEEEATRTLHRAIDLNCTIGRSASFPLNAKPKPFPPIPNPNFPLSSSSSFDVGPTPPLFKFHNIWIEPDEIRFLRGLLDSASDGLVFPRDLPVFYDRFSRTVSQPYTKSQLFEKLCRLRKKFRLVSSCLARGLHVIDDSRKNKVENELDGYGDGELSEVAARAVLDVFDECVREGRMRLVRKLNQEAMSSSSPRERKMVDFVKRWEEQYALELDVFARRLRLKLENSLHQN
ncbi:putative transcription factor [Senna tora]|uniref:Putative transcription factor n=1 Tax=Senna tora TaxID=362788 RepID=A0A834WS73_9FABA|nr:putative transcription factor [Senna tora]